MGIRTLGIDISSGQGYNYNFPLARRQGVEFALIKGSGGSTYLNPCLDAQVKGARAANIEVGFYHYMFEPLSGQHRRSAEDEFKVFRRAVGPYVQPGSTFWLDMEEFPQSINYGGSVAQFALDFDAFVFAEWGCHVGVYTGTYYIQGTDMKGDSRLAKLPVWLASWQESKPADKYALPFTDFRLWQYSSSETIGGQNTDTNYFYGGIQDLQALGVPFSGTLNGKSTVQTLADAVSASLLHDTAIPSGDVLQDGSLSPVTAQWLNDKDGGVGIPYKMGMWVYNPTEQKHYYSEWEMGEYKPWQLLG